MSVYKEVVKKITPFMKSKVFFRSGYSGKFYYVANDIAYCITFDKPSIFIYVHAHIMPLYIPTEFVHLTYGNRLSYMRGLQFPEISENEPEYIEKWRDTFCRTMEDRILPFFMQINSPEELIAEIERGSPSLRLFFLIPPVHLETIKMYTYLYLQRLPETKKAIDSYRNELVQRTGLFTKKCYELYFERSNEVEALIHEDKDKREMFVKETIDHTKTFFREVIKKEKSQ